MAEIKITLTDFGNGVAGADILRAQRAVLNNSSNFVDYTPSVEFSASQWQNGQFVPYNYAVDNFIRLLNVATGTFCDGTVSNTVDVDSRVQNVSYNGTDATWDAPTKVGTPESYDVKTRVNEGSFGSATNVTHSGEPGSQQSLSIDQCTLGENNDVVIVEVTAKYDQNNFSPGEVSSAHTIFGCVSEG